MKFLVIVFFLFITNNLFSQEIRTIDLLYLIDNHKQFNDILKTLDDEKKIIEKKILDDETIIKLKQQSIEDSKLIINSDDLALKINSLNNNIKQLKDFVAKYNYYFDQNINLNKNILLNKIAEICQNYSISNNIDIIVGKNNYFISAKNIDITNSINSIIINEKLNFKIYKEEEIFAN